MILFIFSPRQQYQTACDASFSVAVFPLKSFIINSLGFVVCSSGGRVGLREREPATGHQPGGVPLLLAVKHIVLILLTD